MDKETKQLMLAFIGVFLMISGLFLVSFGAFLKYASMMIIPVGALIFLIGSVFTGWALGVQLKPKVDLGKEGMTVYLFPPQKGENALSQINTDDEGETTRASAEL